MSDRFNRNELLFGRDGQRELLDSHVIVIGAGGVGSHVIQQLSYLGVGRMTVVDGGTLKETSRNRYVTCREGDGSGKAKKVGIARRLVNETNSAVEFYEVEEHFPCNEAIGKFKDADLIIGCVDNDAARAAVNEHAMAAQVPYIDLATDTDPDDSSRFGGHVFLSMQPGCLVCQDVIDLSEIDDLCPDEALRLYGIHKDALDQTGPSVVSLNGIIASLGVTEAMCLITGLRPAVRSQKYYGKTGKVVIGQIQEGSAEHCYFCNK